MMRVLNVMAVFALLGSAFMAYQVKYETVLVNEKLRKAEGALQREKDAVAVLKAEWELLNRPSRLQLIAQPEAGMKPLSARQFVHADEIPQAKPESDRIGDALGGLLTGSLPASVPERKATPRPLAKTPSAATPRPDLKTVRPKVATRLPPARSANAAPLVLRPPANLGSARPATPQRDPIGAMLAAPRPPARVQQAR